MFFLREHNPTYLLFILTRPNKLSEELSEFIINPHSRQWMNLIFNELDLHIINQRLINQKKKLDSCSVDTIQGFFGEISPNAYF